jgi:hypothetical protein
VLKSGFLDVDRARVMVGCIYVFYMIPITFAAEYGTLAIIQMFPSLASKKDTISGFVNSALLSLFLS